MPARASKEGRDQETQGKETRTHFPFQLYWSATVTQSFTILPFSLLEQDHTHTNRASLTLSGTAVLMGRDAGVRVVLQIWAHLTRTWWRHYLKAEQQ